MNVKSVWCVTVEDDSSGAVDWWYDREVAEQDYNESLRLFPDDEIAFFELKVPMSLKSDDITHLADLAMWDREYTPIRWRAGKNHSVTPHSVPATD